MKAGVEFFKAGLDAYRNPSVNRNLYAAKQGTKFAYAAIGAVNAGPVFENVFGKGTKSNHKKIEK